MPGPRFRLPTPIAPWPRPEGYPEVLPDHRAIADHIVSLASADIDQELVEEYFRGCSARLCWMELSALLEGPTDAHARNLKLERRYATFPLETLPPIVVEQGRIEDGHHRFRVAKAAGASGMWCYCVEPGDG